MANEDIKNTIKSLRSIDREIVRIREEIEKRRTTLLSESVHSERVKTSPSNVSIPERVYFALEQLYVQLSKVLQQQYKVKVEIENKIASLDPIEQEIARAWAAGKTEEQIGVQVGYSDRTIRRAKVRIANKLTEK